MWTEAVSGNKKLRIQKYPGIRVDGARVSPTNGTQFSDWWNMTGSVTMTSGNYQTQTWYSVRESNCGIYPGSFILERFWAWRTGKSCELSFWRKGCFCNYANWIRELKVLSFNGLQLRWPSIKFAMGNIQTLLVLETYPLTSIIQDQAKEGKLLGLDCAALKMPLIQLNKIY